VKSNENNEIFDVIVIGGGINGTGIAADAAGRGLNVFLCEQYDLASGTSSNSSKLIHGGLRYLEHYEFRLVREGLAEREVLLKNAPHIIKPLTFRLPHQHHLRPFWMIRIGLFLYDHLAKRVTLNGSKSFRFSQGSPLIDDIKRGFEYSDAWVDDSRLVVLNAISAKANGAKIYTRKKCINVQRLKKFWLVHIEDTVTGEVFTIKSAAIVNAAGPWVASLFTDAFQMNSPQKIRLVKGSHIVVPRVHEEKEAYILQNKDKRIVFVLPFEDNFSLIGTTDVEVEGKPEKVGITDEEIEYLISITNSYFKNKISKLDVVHTFSGVRPLLDDNSDSAQFVTRDYTLELDDSDGMPPIISIFGGKITTYRKLAEAAVDKLSQLFPNMKSRWTEYALLPGGNFANKTMLIKQFVEHYPWVPKPTLSRYVNSYGTLSNQILGNTKCERDLGLDFGAGLYEVEVKYLINNEWACNLEDIIWRRTKLGLYLTKMEKDVLTAYIQQYLKLLTADRCDKVL